MEVESLLQPQHNDTTLVNLTGREKGAYCSPLVQKEISGDLSSLAMLTYSALASMKPAGSTTREGLPSYQCLRLCQLTRCARTYSETGGVSSLSYASKLRLGSNQTLTQFLNSSESAKEEVEVDEGVDHLSHRVHRFRSSQGTAERRQRGEGARRGEVGQCPQAPRRLPGH
jgi:hypothetical protein